MNKSERVLNLSNQLKNGKKINKESICCEMKISKRTFERDIQSIRNVIAEEFEGNEVIYDARRDVYYIDQIKKKHSLMEDEYLVVMIILLGSKGLEANEMKGLLDGLEQVSEHIHVPVEKLKEMLDKQTKDYLPGKPLMKLISDLMRCIVRKDSIRMQYLEDNQQRIKIEVIPIDISFQDNHFIVKAVERKKGKEIGYRIEQIESFEVLQEKEIPQ